MEDATIAGDPAQAAGMERGEALAGKLAGYPGPAYRRAYLEGLLRSGMGFLRSGNARSADYCLGKVEAAVQEAASAAASAAAGEESPVEDAPGDGMADTGAPGAAVSAPGRRVPAAARDRRSPLERLNSRWREERFLKAAAILERHGRRLTALERRAYRESLAKWSRAHEPGQPASAARRADHALLDLRRRLYGRILRSQKAGLAPRGARALVPVHEQFPGPIGPYNDRQNLEGVITLLAEADPAWVEEFLDLYRGLAALRALIPSHRPA